MTIKKRKNSKRLKHVGPSSARSKAGKNTILFARMKKNV